MLQFKGDTGVDCLKPQSPAWTEKECIMKCPPYYFLLLFVIALACYGATHPIPGPQGTPPSQQAQKETSDPSKGSVDVDQKIDYPIDRVMAAARQALATYGCEVKKETADSLEATRSRHVGVMVGSGGEKVTVKLSKEGNETRVVVKTGKGFVGRLGKKNWSTPIFNEMVRILKTS